MPEPRVSRERVERVMRAALDSSTARLAHYDLQPLEYLTVLPGRWLGRLTGSAHVDAGSAVGWSAVVKVLAAGHDRREVLAYRSGLLTDLPGRFRQARVYSIEDLDDGTTWLWLEDLHDVYDRKWPLEQFANAARDLGAFNGFYLVSRSLPAEPWLNEWLRYAWAEQHVEFQKIPNYRADFQRTLQLPQVQRSFGSHAAASFMQLLDDQQRFVECLSRIPQTLCHHESALANLFAVLRSNEQLETVAVDWENIGPGPIGAEIATLTFGTLRRCEFDAARADELDDAVFSGYVEGLRDAGWQGPRELVRLGYTAAIALRWLVLASVVRMLVDGAEPVRTSQGTIVPAEAVLEQRVRLVECLLGRADEARHLLAWPNAIL